jgi:hypothetical protein
VLSNKYTPAQYAERAATWEKIFKQYFLQAA